MKRTAVFEPGEKPGNSPNAGWADSRSPGSHIQAAQPPRSHGGLGASIHIVREALTDCVGGTEGGISNTLSLVPVNPVHATISNCRASFEPFGHPPLGPDSEPAVAFVASAPGYGLPTNWAIGILSAPARNADFGLFALSLMPLSTGYQHPGRTLFTAPGSVDRRLRP